MLRYIDQYSSELKNKRVILRVDYNVPIENGKVKDDTRIIQSLETLRFLMNLNCDLVLLTHLGRPKTQEDKLKYTTKPIYTYLKENKIFNEIEFIEGFDKEVTFQGGKIYLFENVRFFEGETKNSLDLARNYSKFGDVFVNDAFGSLHRLHSSVAGISTFLPTFFGLLVKKEIENLKKFFNPYGRFITILGGAKISDKLGLIKNIKADNIVIGGAMALTIYKKMGKNIGKSFFEEVEVDSLINNPKVLLPQNFIIVDDNLQNPRIGSIDEIGEGIAVDSLLDESILNLIKESDMIFWNGPLGIFEKGFDKGSINLLKIIKQNKQSKDKGFRAIGGGDTVRFLNEYTKKTGEKAEEFVDFISTGGGATLEFLEKGNLEAIEYIQKNSQSLKI